MSTLTIGKLTYIVTREGEKIVLTGKRGARYVLCRNVPKPWLMFAVDDRGFGLAKPLQGLWFFEIDGKVVQASQVSESRAKAAYETALTDKG